MLQDVLGARASEMGRGSLQGRVSVQEPRIAVRKPLRAGRQTSGAPMGPGCFDRRGALAAYSNRPEGQQRRRAPCSLLATQTLEANGLRG